MTPHSRNRKAALWSVLLVLPALAAVSGQTCDPNSLAGWTLPHGYSIQKYHDGKIPYARSLAISGNSKLNGPVITYVSAHYWFGPVPQNITAMVDLRGRGAADYVVQIATQEVLDNASLPTGIAWHKGSLYIAVVQPQAWFRLYVIDNVDRLALTRRSAKKSDLRLLRNDAPYDFMHGWKYIRFDSEGNLYMALGANANIALMNGTGVARDTQWPALDNLTGGIQTSKPFQKAQGFPRYRFATIYRFRPPYTGGMPGAPKSAPLPEVVATGVRMSVGMDWHPVYGLYFTDNGRDNIGGANMSDTNNSPDCEFNFYGPTNTKKKPTYYGYPYCHTGSTGGQDKKPYRRDLGIGENIADPDANKGEAAMKCNGGKLAFRQAIQALGPHTAPLGMRFYHWETFLGIPLGQKANFPRKWDKAAFIALRGSWNRDPKDPTAGPIGAKVVSLTLSTATKVDSFESFLSGGVPGDKGSPTGPDPKPDPKLPYYGRPVDIEQLPDGSILVSDDHTGRVYRVSFCQGLGFGHYARYGVGRCGSGKRSAEADLHEVAVPSKRRSCSVNMGSLGTVAYKTCLELDITDRKTFAYVAYTLKRVPDKPELFRLAAAVVMMDYDGVVGNGWISSGVTPYKTDDIEMTGLTVVLSRPVLTNKVGASIVDYQLGKPEDGECLDQSCFIPTKDVLYVKENTMKAAMAGNALVQQFETLVSKKRVRTAGNKLSFLISLGDIDPDTGILKEHWLVSRVKLPINFKQLDPTPPKKAPVVNPGDHPAPAGGALPPAFPTPNGGCSVDGTDYQFCAALDAGDAVQPAPCTHYYILEEGVLRVAIKGDVSSIDGSKGGWFGWMYNADGPGNMVGGDAVFVRGGKGPASAIKSKMNSYIPDTWTTSTMFSNVRAKQLAPNQILATFSMKWPEGARSITVSHAAGPYSGGPSDGVAGMEKHIVRLPGNICIIQGGLVGPANDCGSCAM